MLPLSVARWVHVLFGSVVVCSQARLFIVLGSFFPTRMRGGDESSVSPCD